MENDDDTEDNDVEDVEDDEANDTEDNDGALGGEGMIHEVGTGS